MEDCCCLTKNRKATEVTRNSIGQSPSCQVCPKFSRDLSTGNSWSFASKTRFFLIANMGSYQSARRSGNCCRLQMTGLRQLIMENGSMHASWMWLKLLIALTTIFSKLNCPVLVWEAPASNGSVVIFVDGRSAPRLMALYLKQNRYRREYLRAQFWVLFCS